VALDEPAQGRLGQERHVAGQHQDGAGRVPARHVRLEHRVSGAEPLLLLDEGGADLGRDRGANLVCGATHHDDHPRADAPGGTHRIGQEGAAAEGMEDLGTGRAHPLGLAGCQNDGGELIHGIDHRSTRHAT
jgi:hypothetical protein